MMGLAKMKQTTQMRMVLSHKWICDFLWKFPVYNAFMAVMFMNNAVKHGPNRKWPWWLMEKRERYWKRKKSEPEAQRGARSRLQRVQLQNNRKSFVEKEWLKCPGKSARACSVWRGMKSEGSPVSSEGVWVLGREERRDSFRIVTRWNYSSNCIPASEV